MSFLLDTNVLLELREGHRCDPGVLAWIENVDDQDIYISVLTVGEIRRGIERIRRRDTDAAAALAAWLEELLSAHGERIIDIDASIAQEWGRLSVPDPLPVVDGLLAATARVRGLALVTRNSSDVARTGVPLVNPFTAA